jgi:hypothetical protein
LETVISYSEPHKWNRVGVPPILGQKLLGRECLVIVENPIIRTNFRPFLYTASVLALWNEFKVNNTHDIKETDELHLCM